MAAELKIGIGADNSGLKQGLQDAESQISAFVSKVGKIGQIGEQLSNIGQKMSVGLTLPIMALGAGALKAYGDIQSLQKGLEAVMGSGASAAKEFERLKEVAKLPGLGMEEAVRGSINLQAIGMDADKSRKILSQFGNAVASVGKGKAEFERAIYGVQQLANTDFPLGEDLNIIKDALPQVSNLLKEAFGTSRSDELAKMGVSSKQVLDTITAGLEKLPRVTGGINGAFENLGDSMKTSLARIGKIIDDTFDISGIIDKLTGYLDTAISYFEGLSPAIQKTILVVTGLVAAAGPLLVVVGGFIAALPTIITGLGALKVGFLALTGPIGLVTAAVVGVVAAFVANWSKINPYIVNTINYFRDLYNESIVVRGAVVGLATMFKNSFAVISNILKTAWEIFKTFAKGTADLFAGVGKVLKGALTGDLGEIKSGLGQMAAAWSSGIASLGKDLGNGIKGLYNDIKRNFSDGLNEVVNGGKLKPITDIKLFNEEKIAEKTSESVTNGVTKGVKKAKEKVGVALLDFGQSFNQNLAGFSITNPLDSLFTEDQLQDFTDRINSTVPRLDESWDGLRASVAENMTMLREDFAQIADFGNFLGDSIATSFNFVVDTIADSFAAIGEAMATGGNIMSSVGNVILGGIASFLSTLGKQMIQYGVAALAMAVLSKMLLNPITAAPAAIAMIAAGAALSLIGGAIKGTLSGGGGGGSVPSGGGGGSQSYSSSFSSGGGGGGEVVFRISGNDLVGVLSRQQDKNTRIGG